MQKRHLLVFGGLSLLLGACGITQSVARGSAATVECPKKLVKVVCEVRTRSLDVTYLMDVCGEAHIYSLEYVGLGNTRHATFRDYTRGEDLLYLSQQDWQVWDGAEVCPPEFAVQADGS